MSLVVVLGHILGSLYHWYDHYFFLDVIVHFAGGAWVVFAAFAFIPFFRGISSRKKFMLSLAFAALTVGAAWEIFEFVIDRYYSPGFQGSPLDTLSDLIIDSLGGIAAALYIKSRD
jgi:hypothetical protein